MSLQNLTPLQKPQTSTVLAPNAISGLQLWLDGNDPAGTGTPPAGGASVSTWVDKSTNAWSFSAGSTVPTFQTNQYLSTLGAILFTGGTNCNFSNGTNALLDTGSPATVAITFNLATWNVAFPNLCILKSNDASHGLYIQLSHLNATYQDIGIGSGSLWTFYCYKWSGISTTTWYTVMWVYNGSGATTAGNFSTYLGNVAGSQSTPAAGTSNGATSYMGTDHNSDPANIYLQQVCIYNAALSSANRLALYNWMTTVAT